MAKKRKTREQKKLADSRHTFNHIFVGQDTPSAKTHIELSSTIIPSYKPKATILIGSYPYLAKDLSKTAMLTLGILAFQIVLFTLLKNHVLTIPGIGY